MINLLLFFLLYFINYKWSIILNYAYFTSIGKFGHPDQCFKTKNTCIYIINKRFIKLMYNTFLVDNVLKVCNKTSGYKLY